MVKTQFQIRFNIKKMLKTCEHVLSIMKREGLFFIVFPLFSYYRWKGKNLKDYMITKENIEKMRENQKRHKY